MFEKMNSGSDDPNKIKKEIKEVPFAGNLVESDISGTNKGSGKMNEIVKTGLNERIRRINEAKLNIVPQQLGYRNKIVRIQSFDERGSYDNIHDDLQKPQGSIIEHAQAGKKLFEELETKYGISVPVDFLIGKNKNGDEVIYSVVDKIQGISLDSADIRNSDEVSVQTGALYASIAKYFLDKYREGGSCLWDINNPGQYVYGRKKGENEDKIYLVDTDIHISNNQSDMYLNMMWLTRHMSGVEKRLQTKFEEARERIREFISQPLPEEIGDVARNKINKNIEEIKKFLNQ